jgi:GT2 family glycosyltransferase
MNYFGEKLDLGIQVVNYKTKNYLITCLEDLLDNLKGSEIAFHIFVLDNASEDDLSDLEIKHKDDPISFFYSDKNGGFGYGHNVLAKKYTADYILLVNPDIRLVKNTTIRHLYDCISSSDEIKVVGVNTHSHWDHGNKIPLLLTRM